MSTVTMRLDLPGRSVISSDHGDTTLIRFTGGYELSIDNDCALSTSEGGAHYSPAVDAESNSTTLATLEGRTVTSAAAEESGALLVTFTDGARLRIGPDEDYESWTLAGPGGRKVVCLPGGELAVWSAEQNS